MNNLVFLSGPHGSGKTTLGNQITRVDASVMAPELYSRNIKFNTEPESRLLLKICGRSIENFEYYELARQNPNKIILGNRCIYDQQVYNRVYQRKGWISQEALELANVLSRNFYMPELRNPRAIILNPGFDICKKHLEKRWNEKGKKWREEDEEYLNLACGEYSKLKDDKKIFYINHEIDLNDLSEATKITNWMKNN